jgi:hypothetical protein
MLKRLYELLAVLTLLAGLTGMGLGFYFLYVQRFIEGFASGLFGFLLLRTGVLILRLIIARGALAESQARVLERLRDGRAP